MADCSNFILRNQDGEIGIKEKITLSDIYEYVAIMLEDSYQFVVLSAPEAIENIRIVQACLLDEDVVNIEVGIENGKEADDDIIFYQSICEEEECFRIFEDFFLKKFKPDMSEYEPVQYLTD